MDCLSEADDHPERFDNLRCDIDLMHQAIVNMDRGNGNLLKVMALQFNEAHHLRANAWLDAARLPPQMKTELKVLKQPVSSDSTGVTPFVF